MSDITLAEIALQVGDRVTGTTEADLDRVYPAQGRVCKTSDTQTVYWGDGSQWVDVSDSGVLKTNAATVASAPQADTDVARSVDVSGSVESHRANAVHDIAQPPAEHDNTAHSEAYITDTSTTHAVSGDPLDLTIDVSGYSRVEIETQLANDGATTDGVLMRVDGITTLDYDRTYRSGGALSAATGADHWQLHGGNDYTGLIGEFTLAMPRSRVLIFGNGANRSSASDMQLVKGALQSTNPAFDSLRIYSNAEYTGEIRVDGR